MTKKDDDAPSVISRITQHYESQGVRTIEVPEWGDNDGPLVIYTAPFTLRDQSRIDFATRKSESNVDALVEVLIQKCQNPDGSRMFTVADKKALREKADVDVVSRVCTDIMGPTTEQLEKN